MKWYDKIWGSKKHSEKEPFQLPSIQSERQYRKMVNEHPAWRAYFENQSTYGIDPLLKNKPYDRVKDEANPFAKEMLELTEAFTHSMGMVKDLLVVVMNQQEKMNKILNDHRSLMEEHSDLLDLLLVCVSEDDI